jgi:transcriptional regulator with XRE-family HTH domain
MDVDGARVRRLREEQVLSLSMLAEKSGVSRETILAIEQGKRNAQPATVHKLAVALDVEPKELMVVAALQELC